jgi:two-component system alkaline phosphatase synthesis response regulator PhoP
MWNILLVEDDPALLIALQRGFEFEGHAVEVARDGEAALRQATEKVFDLMVLDVMLPKLSGYDVCQRLRHAGNLLPVIMLTARDQEIDKVLGLKMGADDYLTKPFSFMELLARVEAILRRIKRAVIVTEQYQFGDVTVNFAALEAAKAGQPINLSQREFRLLKYFIEHRGEVVTRDQLLDSVWNYDRFPLSRTVDMHIAKLRQKIETLPSHPGWLITVHGAGYKFMG